MVAILELRICHVMIPASGYLYAYPDVLFECPGILGTGGTLAVTLLRDDLFKACFGSDHASAVLLAAFSSDRTPVGAATACLVPFLLDPAAALGRPPPLGG